MGLLSISAGPFIDSLRGVPYNFLQTEITERAGKMKRKIHLFSLLACALLIACGMLSPAPSRADCEHQWTLQSSVSPTCTDPGQAVWRCSVCGEERTEEIPALGHSFDRCVQLSSPTCTENGIIRCYCIRDESHYEDKELPALGHDWGEWKTVRRASLTRPGVSERECSRCGAKEQEKIPEKIRRRQYALTLVMVPAPETPEELKRQAAESGMKLAYDCALVNLGKNDLWIRSFIMNGETVLLPEALLLPAGQPAVIPLARAVTEADLARGDAVRSEVSFIGETEEGKQACVSNAVSLSCRLLPEGESPAEAPAVLISQAVTSRPENEAGYVPDEIVRYTVTVVSEGDQPPAELTLKGIGSEEALVIADLQPGETRTVDCEYRVTEQDAVNGYLCWIQSADSLRSNLLIVPVTAK